MRHALLATALLCVATSAAWADSYREFPAPTAYPFARSRLTRQRVVIPPYPRPFGVRVYSTQPHEPYTNVPPYAVIVPY